MDGLVKLVDGLDPVGDDWLAVRTHAFKILDFFQAVIGLAKELGVCTPSSDQADARIGRNLAHPVEGTGSRQVPIIAISTMVAATCLQAPQNC